MFRREDARFAARIDQALRDAASVVNVGAGTGAYEPAGRHMIPIEPSRVMIAQRPRERAPAILATAQELPLADESVDAAMTVLSLHHWFPDAERGVREMRRVARGPVIIMTIDADVCGAMWLFSDYLPEVRDLDRKIFPPMRAIADWLGGETTVETVPVPNDTCDWSLLSFWAHPERVLDRGAREATSGFARMPAEVVERVVSQVGRDLETGAWDQRHGALRRLTELDVGLRLIVNRPS